MTHSPAPFDQLVERHRSELLAYLTRLLGDAHDAEDACQDALLRAYRAFGRLKPDSNPRAWLYKIATNTAFNHLKSRKRRATHNVDIDLDRLPANPGVTLEQREQLRAVAHAVEALPPKQRAALMLRQFQGLNYAEIATSLGGNSASARANVYQAIKKLREALADE
jgi:RNA polymerase sigma factor (sigma-70 family)